MVENFRIVTLCGSTKFKDEFIAAQKRLTLEGYIVISVGLFGHSGDNEAWSEDIKKMLDDMHKRKIDLSDEIFVINVGGYIGASTQSEIEYAKKTNKPVNYLESQSNKRPPLLASYPDLQGGDLFLPSTLLLSFISGDPVVFLYQKK